MQFQARALGETKDTPLPAQSCGPGLETSSLQVSSVPLGTEGITAPLLCSAALLLKKKDTAQESMVWSPTKGRGYESIVVVLLYSQL